jgi:hypothetical protein
MHVNTLQQKAEVETSQCVIKRIIYVESKLLLK